MKSESKRIRNRKIGGRAETEGVRGRERGRQDREGERARIKQRE